MLVLRLGNYPLRRMNPKLANDTKMWKGNGITTTLLFSLKGLEILHQEKRERENHSNETSTAFSSTSPDLLTGINQVAYVWVELVLLCPVDSLILWVISVPLSHTMTTV